MFVIQILLGIHFSKNTFYHIKIKDQCKTLLFLPKLTWFTIGL